MILQRIRFLIGLSVLLVCLLIFASFYYQFHQKQKQKLENLHSYMYGLNELVTQENLYRKIIYLQKKEFFILDKESLFSLDFLVKAGIDLDDGWDLSLPLSFSNSVKIHLPPMKILQVQSLDQNLKVYFSKKDWLSSFKVSDYARAIETERTQLAEADHEELLERGQKELELFLEKQFYQRGFSSVQFIYDFKRESEL